MLLSLDIIGTVLLTGCGNAKLKNGEDIAITVNGTNITANDLYKKLRDKYGVSTAIDMIDKEILNTIYKDDESIEKQAANQIESLKKQYSDNWEETLKSAGYENEAELKEYFVLNYQRNQDIEDYVKESIKDDEINAYYKENTVGGRPTRPTSRIFCRFCWTEPVGWLKNGNPTRPTASNKTTPL